MKRQKLLDAATREKIDADLALRAIRGPRDAARKQVATVQRALAELQARFDLFAAVKSPPAQPPFKLPKSTRADSGVSIAVWSDWHVAERVDPRKIDNLNKYSPEIAKERAAHCAISTAKLHRHVASTHAVDSMVLFLGGDFITGYLHPELEQTNALAPVEEAMFAQQLLISAINTLLDEKKIRQIRIICMRGNHGRTTFKMQFKNDYETSLETFIYTTLFRHFQHEPRIRFDIPRGDVHHAQILPGWCLRCFHGHQVKYGDGVGGLTIPLNKWLAKQDRTQVADFNLMGHYHHYSLPSTRVILNGSLKGFDEYAASKGLPFQEPLQSFALLDAERRMVAQHLPIFCTS